MKDIKKYDINRKNKRDFELFVIFEQLEKERYKMDENKMHLINKIFNNETIRTVWNKEEEKYYISIVDIVGVLAESKNPTVYWRVLKKRLKEEGNETVTNCNGLKLKAKDGKYRITDVWKENGIEKNIEYAILTNEIYREWSGMTAKEYKQYKGLRKENLRDNMDNIELILTDLSEEATKRLAAKQKPNGLKENIKVAQMGGHAAKVARDDIEKNLGESVVTKTNKLNYKYIEEEEKQVKLKESDKKKLK